MSCAVRLVLICLLSLAVPLQNAMAAGVGACAQRHQPTAVGHAHWHSGSSHRHGAHEAVREGQQAMHDATAPASQDQALHDVGATACTLCAGCCTGGALPSTWVASIAAATVRFTPPPAPHAVPDTVPAPLERPPRTTAL